MVCHTFRYNSHVDYEVEYDPQLPVYLAIDPGGVVYAVLFIQFSANGEVRVLDEIYAYRWTHEAVVSEFKANALAGVTVGGAIDIAAKQAQNAMPIALEEWYNDTGLILFTQKHAVDDTVERLLWALAPNPNTGNARLRIHPRCHGLISEMGGGESPVPDGGPWLRYESPTGLGPPMRKNDHASKALGYLLAGPHSQIAAPTRTATSVSYLDAGRSGNRSARRG